MAHEDWSFGENSQNWLNKDFLLLGGSLILIIIAATVLFLSLKGNNNSSSDNAKIEFSQADNASSEATQEKILVDIAGAVQKPGLYEMAFGSRLNDLLKKADGLSQEADRDLFDRQFNRAKPLADGEKIYIPKKGEAGRVNVAGASIQSSAVQASQQIDINTATVSQLDNLPGVGPITANKIITGRPYNSIDELQTKKAVNKATFEKIKSLIAAY